MIVPETVAIDRIKDELLRLIATQDSEYLLHAEELLTTMSQQQAIDWKRKLKRMNWQKRVADRSAISGSDTGLATSDALCAIASAIRRSGENPAKAASPVTDRAVVKTRRETGGEGQFVWVGSGSAPSGKSAVEVKAHTWEVAFETGAHALSFSRP